MHRGTMAGLALASALAELEEDGRVVLNSKQREAVWATFDLSMDKALEEVPAGCVVKVHTTPPQQSKLPASTSSGETPCASVTVAPEHQFPLYRKINGVTTIVLKDPVVVVSKRNGEEESLNLDYLTVRIKDVTEKTPKSTRKRGRT
jgi:hypothetical protein